MCLYPKRIINKKYTATKKNGGNIPEMPIIGYQRKESEYFQPFEEAIYDTRIATVEVPCGQCIECRQTKAREWQVRLLEEIKTHKNNYFITLTFAPKELEEVCKKTRLKECNAVAGYAVRHMLERWRKDHKTSLKHWLITELGHEGTERIHLHGLIFTDKVLEFGEVEDNNLRTWKYWKYGHIYVGDYVNERTINYISKYITKIDTDHKGFIGQILASPGIGREFIDRLQEFKSTRYDYVPRNAADYYRLQNGCKVKLPKYYKNKLYTEEQREEIWRNFLDTETLSVLGTSHNKRDLRQEVLQNIETNARELNNALGYGNDTKEWRKKDYNITRRMLQQVERDKQQIAMLEKLQEAGQATKDQISYYYKLRAKMTRLEHENTKSDVNTLMPGGQSAADADVKK